MYKAKIWWLVLVLFGCVGISGLAGCYVDHDRDHDHWHDHDWHDHDYDHDDH